jgi:hypothetical protein
MQSGSQNLCRAYQVDGVSQARLATELERIALAIRQGRLATIDGGLSIQPEGNKLRIHGDLVMMVIA